MTELLHASNTFANYNHPIADADVVFLGVPFTSTTWGKPAVYGPVMVREGLKIISGLHKDFNIFDIKFADAGDVEVAHGSYGVTAKRIRETVEQVREINKNAFPIFIGGEHLISLPIVESLKPKTIIHLDAHSDMQREIEEVGYTHGTWAYHAGKLAKLVQAGVRGYSREEKEVAKENGVAVCDIRSISKIKMQRPIHLSIDIDVFSPEFVETGHPEGTLKPEQVFDMLEKIKADSLDICEIADDRLPSKTGVLAAEIIKRVLYARFKR